MTDVIETNRVFGHRRPEIERARVAVGLYPQFFGRKMFAPACYAAVREGVLPLGLVFRFEGMREVHVAALLHDGADNLILCSGRESDCGASIQEEWIELLGSIAPFPRNEKLLLAALADFGPLAGNARLEGLEGL